MYPIRVLIADDNKEYCEILRELISINDDIKVVGIAWNGTQAIELLLQTKPDVLLLDLVMPEMDGLEVLRRILKDNSCTVFIVSAIGNDEITKHALKLGACCSFVKPFNMQILLSTIRKVTEESVKDKQI